MVGARYDAVLGELAFRQRHLAAAADRPPAAYRIDVDAERARRLKHRGADFKPSSPAGGREDDQRVATGSGHEIDQLRRRRRSSRSRRRASMWLSLALGWQLSPDGAGAAPWALAGAAAASRNLRIQPRQ